MNKDAIAAFCAFLNAVLVVLAVQLEAGNVPIPQEWGWAIPMLVAGITAFSPWVKLWGRENNPRPDPPTP